jgi:RNA polymerase sigma factor (sigma-70 family)
MHSAAKHDQEEALQRKEVELRRLAAERNREEFFKQILPFLQPLKTYIKRQLRYAYLTLQVRTPVVTSGDILDEVILKAYEDFARKPEDLTLEQWLYQIANKKVKNYISRQKSKEKRRKSLETLNQSELRTLEEMPITADADGEPWLPEELDDSEYYPRDFIPPRDDSNPEEQLEREEEIRQILKALCRIPGRDRMVLDLFLVEGLSKEAVAKILNIPADQVPKIAEKARARVREEIKAQSKEGADMKGKAS